MHVYTLRISDELANDVKLCAEMDGESVNKWLTTTVMEAVDQTRNRAGKLWNGSPDKKLVDTKAEST